MTPVKGFVSAGLLAAVLYGVLVILGQPHVIAVTAAITLLTATLWVTEWLPIPVTSLLPFVAFPMAGVLDYQQASSALGSHVILLLMGAFMLSKGLEKSNLHRRLAVTMLQFTGTGSARRLLLAFMLTAGLLSMWISNTATTLMLLPIALAVLQQLDNKHLAVALLLGIAYAASLGGLGTPIGTPPNVIFVSVYAEQTGQDISFIDWMGTGLPIVLLGLPLMVWWLGRGLGKLPAYTLPEQGGWQPQERRVLCVFSLVALAWVLRPYWTAWLGVSGIRDSTIALAGVVLMFLVPSGNGSNQGSGQNGSKVDTLLDWPTATAIPWGMLLLFAGGICIAKAFVASGLSDLMASGLADLSVLPLPLLILAICLAVTFLTEITSNTATATLLMPILASVALAVNIDPLLLMMPAALSASCAFMLPVATAPNAIVYGSELIPIKQMARQGLMLNLLMGGLITLVVYLTRA